MTKKKKRAVRQPWTEERKRNAMRLHLQGLTPPQVAAEVGSSDCRVRHVLREAGVLRRVYVPRQPWTEERKQKAVWLYQQGSTIQQVADAIGSSSRHVGRVLREANVVRSKKETYQGAGNPAWRGGRVVDKSGYILLYRPEHPDSNKKGYVREHRLVLAEYLGRRLRSEEVVHHIDGDPANNGIENLRLYPSNGEHLQEELANRVPNWSVAGKARLQAAADRKKEAARRRRARS